MSSEALAKEDWSFGGLRRNISAAGSCPWGSTDFCLAIRTGCIYFILPKLTASEEVVTPVKTGVQRICTLSVLDAGCESRRGA